ncbi:MULTISPECIES: glycosyltransferase family 4 protein [Niastella]|uniref:Glycosyltransferase family 4 protein n=1 Tax=Niastella soli TaxID=2821487 RepID=A0ABS3YVZ5_9BACT|nr:glycosyltransferase family 4 protein [Niastella soli]MBO9202058.1 glycosyltransferase family 4 protein [Niastella soli]
MKIAMLAPITWRTPPVNYGPWEQVASVLTEALVKNGMDVTLFATGDSVTKAKLQSVCRTSLGEHPADAKVWECLHISNLMEQASQFDIIHNHFDFLPLTYSRLIRCPVITTIHGFSSEQIVPVYKKYNAHASYVSISHSNRHPELQYLDTVYNGINEEQFQFGQGAGDYLLYFGRFHPHKGAYEAIQIAIQSNKRLILCGLVQDEDYFKEKVVPYLNDTSIIYKGNVGPALRNELLANTLALLHPINFEEPFGLSVAEAMMCGTPVIAFNRGSMPELIKDRRTGFIVRNIKEAVIALDNIKSISRQACREHALDKFSSQVMAIHYMQLYEKVAHQRCGL